MKTKIIAAALAVGLAAPAAASTVLDFTTAAIGTGSPGGVAFGGATYTISASPGTLVDATHSNNVGCTGYGWDFACAPVNGRYDVGFGVLGADNPNETDGIGRNGIDAAEYVQVAFTGTVRVLGFAGMLTYDDSANTGGTETVVLEYSSDGGTTFNSVFASALFDDNDLGSLYGTVGLAFRDDINIIANVLRFKAGGVSPFDDNNANITAAGLIVAPVPVPAALPLMLAGLGAFGWAARRKKQMAS